MVHTVYMKEPEVNDIINLLKEKPDEESVALIEKAFNFAKKAHEGQKRASGDPYFTHVFETAKNLARYEMTPTTIAAGLMHDVLEDTKVSRAEMERQFGKEIVTLVEGVTKLGKLKYRGEEQHVESLRKFFIAVAKDFRVLIIKLADRLHNLQTLQYVKPEKQKRIALESLEVYAPLANRFGIGKLRGEIEDAAFPYVYPEDYKIVKSIVDEKKHANQKYVQEIKDELEKKLARNSIIPIEIDYRVKHLYSFWKKYKKYNMDVDHIYDLIALRVVVGTVQDCYMVLGIIHDIWKPLPGRIKDYIALPKPNGYQSLHTTVFTDGSGIAEIQIRTLEMHGRAEYGIASHFNYKKQSEKSLDEKWKWADQFKKIAKTESKTPDEFLKDLKMDTFSDRIFVFTPKGAVIDLPEGSSPIDFAYAIHSDIGNTIASSKVNGKMSPLSTVLHSGDIVEVVANKKSHPASKWLEYAKTTTARKHINAYLKENSLLSKFLSFGKK